MGAVDELVARIMKLSPATKVFEYQQALYLRAGRVIKKPIRWDKETKRKLREEERQVYEELGGFINIKDFYMFLPFRRPTLPEGYHRSRILGRLRHPQRYQKDVILRTGIYPVLPGLHDVIKNTKQQKSFEIKSLHFLTSDDPPVPMNGSLEIVWYMDDLLKAYLAAHDYEEMLRFHGREVFNRHMMGRPLTAWAQNATIQDARTAIRDDLEKVIHAEYGLRVPKVNVFDVIPAPGQSVFLNGLSAKVESTVEQVSPS